VPLLFRGGSRSEGRPGAGRPVGYLAEDPVVTGNAMRLSGLRTALTYAFQRYQQNLKAYLTSLRHKTPINPRAPLNSNSEDGSSTGDTADADMRGCRRS